MPKSRDKIKSRFEIYLRQIEGEEHKQANLKVVANTYLKQESASSHNRHSHKERNDGSHDKHNRHSRHSSRRFCPFVKDEPRSHKMEVHAVEKTPQRTEKERSKYCEYYKSKTHDTEKCAILKKK